MEPKLFCGARVRNFRESRQLSQKHLAIKIGISTSYLNQIESDQRPLTANVLLELSRTLVVPIESFTEGASDRLLDALTGALSDAMFASVDVGSREPKIVSRQAPGVATAFTRLYDDYRRLSEEHERLQQASAIQANAGYVHQPAVDEVRDFFQSRNNYIELLDRAAESLSEAHSLYGDGQLDRLTQYVKTHHKVTTVFDSSPATANLIRRYDERSRTLYLNGLLDRPIQAFAVAHQIALLEQREAIQDLIAEARLQNDSANKICQIALANFFARALSMPYRRFQSAVHEARYDVEYLSHIFVCGFEQVCQRISTLQRRGAEDIPFFFLRVDRAGNFSKWQTVAGLKFPRHSGACPLWNIHHTFDRPDQLLVQVIEMPDGKRYLSLARATTRSGGHYLSPLRHYATGFGCDFAFASRLVYSDRLDVARLAPTPIGPGCRECSRADCNQRAFPAPDLNAAIDTNSLPIMPYGVL